MQLLHLFIQRKSFTMMTVLMLGTMCALIVASAWLNLRKGIISVPDSHYDFIIVGAGTAGCVLASQLALDVTAPKILLIEAGDVFPWWSYIPLAAPLLQQTSYDWSYRTTPQLFSSRGLNDNISAWPRGRGLGGSGQMNYMVHFPGSEEDFKIWEKMGITGWNYNEIKSAMNYIVDGHSSNSCVNDFKMFIMPEKLSDYCPKKHHQIHKLQQTKLRISPVSPEISELSQVFIAGGRELNELRNNMQNFAPTWSTIHNGNRWSTFDGFLKPILGKSNLHILVKSLVSKVLFSGGKKAMGVEIFQSINKTLHIYAKKEIILCAGSINTPQILLLSGIGPKRHLEELGIPLIKHLPVGLNLHDHLNLPLYVSITKPTSVTLNKILRLSELSRYILFKEGYLASSAIAGVGSMSKHIGIVLFGLGSIDENLLQRVANYKPHIFKSIFPFTHNSSQEGFVLLASCLQPQSRGTILLSSVSPIDPPIIDPQYLSHKSDIQCMTDAVKMSARLMKTKAFQNLGATLHLPDLHDCEATNASVDDNMYIECLLRTTAITGYHPGGTCKMGNADDISTVVDSSMRVHGIAGLRVVDASTLPTPISGHPNSVIAALATRVSSIILKSPAV